MKRVTETDFTTRVYQYGAVPVDTFPQEGIEELFRANRLWNDLVALHRKSRDEYDSARCDADSEYASLQKSLQELNEEIDEAYNNKRNARMKAGTKDASHPLIKEANEKIQALQVKRREFWAPLKEARTRADKIIDKKKLNNAFRIALNEAQQVKNTDGLNAVTANLTADYFRTARDRTFKDPRAKLQFHRFDGTGVFFFRFRRKGLNTDGVAFSELFARDEDDKRPFVFLGTDETRKKPRLRLRIKVAGGQKESSREYAHFDLILHRPVPEEAQVQNGKLVRTRVGDKFSHTVNLTVREPDVSGVKLSKKAIGIDIGFRKAGKEKIRAAAMASSDPKDPVEYIDVSETFLKRIEHIDALRSRMDEKATRLGEIIKPLLKKGAVLPEDHKQYRFVKSIASTPPNVTLSFEKAYKLGSWMVKYGKGELPAEVEQEAVKWWKENSRVYRESHNLRRKAYLERKALYRDIAANLIKKRQPIGVEMINLSVFAEIKDKDNPLGNVARLNRFLVAPSELLGAIKNAGQREGVPVVEVAAQNTSRTCSNCGHLYKELGAEPIWTCPGCEQEHDRDHNAAINIARRAEEVLRKTDATTK